MGNNKVSNMSIEMSDRVYVENTENTINTEISDKMKENNEAESTIPNEYISVNALDFTGEWHRTNTLMRYFVDAIITNQTNTSFNFKVEGYDSVSGSMEGTAKFVSDKIAVYEVEDEWVIEYYTKVIFLIKDNTLQIRTDKNSQVKFPARNAPYITGEYIKGEPYYTNANLENEIFETDEMKEKVKILMGDASYNYMLEVFDFGTNYNNSNLTYSGFENGCGLGIDILLEDDKMYFLLYCVYYGGYTFYTNDSEYQDKLPDYFQIERPNYKLSFIYKDV